MTTPHELYTPGHVPQKLAMLAFGVGLMLFGLSQFVPNLLLTLTGEHAEARSVAVVKEKPGFPDEIARDDAAAASLGERFDRSVRFWNTFLFTDSQGRPHEVRVPSHSLLKPGFPISDQGGLPYTLRVAFDPAHPERIVFHTVFSTWVFPVLVTLIGLLTSGAALLLLQAARQPIEMPVPHNHDE